MFKMAASMKENCVENYFAEFHDCMLLKSDYNQISKLNHILTNLLRVKTADMEGLELVYKDAVKKLPSKTHNKCEALLLNLYLFYNNGPNLRKFESKKQHDEVMIMDSSRSLFLDELVSAIDRRFSGDLHLFRGSSFINFRNWPQSSNDGIDEFGDKDIQSVLAVCESSLKEANVEVDNIEHEWSRLKTELYNSNRDIHSLTWKQLWEQLHTKYPNMFSLVTYLQTLPSSSVDAERGFSRVRLEGTFISDMESLVDLSQQLTEDICECLTNCYRWCRNVCALCTENQTHLHDSTRFIQLTHSLMINCLQCNRRSEDYLLLLRCTVQFLANYSSGNKVNQTEIQGKFCDVFRSLLLLEDIKLREYVLMVVHIILTDIASVMSAGLGDTHWSLLHTSIQVTTESDSQNGLLVTEDCLRIPGFCEKLFSEMSIQTRILISEVLINTLQRLPEDNMVTADNVSAADNVASADNVLSSDIDTDQNFDIPAVSNIHYIAADFILQSHLISSMSTDSSNHLQVMCTVKELECLCIASAHHRLYGSLQENEQLLKTAISLLKCIEEIGKQGDNVFTNVDKMSKQREVNTDHPVYGLKRDLIRLLGNMAYKHQVNQNLIRELDGIPLILEQTNIDGKNPFITQWSVFAIHNLTEQNADNRQYIAQLKLQGVDNNQSIMKEMGLKAETDGRKVVIKKDTD